MELPAAEQRYEPLVENEEISPGLVGTVEAMVEAQELASSQSQYPAGSAEHGGAADQSEQGLIQARRRLALAMGTVPTGWRWLR